MKLKWLKQKSIGPNWLDFLSIVACGSMVNLKDPAQLGEHVPYGDEGERHG